jgi:hypothetical protein
MAEGKSIHELKVGDTMEISKTINKTVAIDFAGARGTP